MLTLPDKFKSSLGTGTSTSLFPVVRFFKGVRIDDPSSWVALDLDDTVNLSIKDHFLKAGGDYPYSGIPFDPLLLTSPKISSSADIINNKYKISNVSLSITNAPYRGEIFSDTVEGLLNAVCQVYYCSAGITDIEDCLLLYTGTVRRYSQTQDKISLQLEDLSQQMLSVKIPTTLVPDEPTFREEDRGTPYPMVYGYSDRHPLKVLTAVDDYGETTGDVQKLIIDKPGQVIGGVWVDGFSNDWEHESLKNNPNHPLITGDWLVDDCFLMVHDDGYIPIMKKTVKEWGSDDFDLAEGIEIYSFTQDEGEGAHIVLSSSISHIHPDESVLPTRAYRPIKSVMFSVQEDSNTGNDDIATDNRHYGFTTPVLSSSWEPWDFEAEVGYEENWGTPSDLVWVPADYTWWEPTETNDIEHGSGQSWIDKNWRDIGRDGWFPVDYIQNGSFNTGIHITGINPEHTSRSGASGIKMEFEQFIADYPCVTKYLIDFYYHVPEVVFDDHDIYGEDQYSSKAANPFKLSHGVDAPLFKPGTDNNGLWLRKANRVAEENEFPWLPNKRNPEDKTSDLGNNVSDSVGNIGQLYTSHSFDTSNKYSSVQIFCPEIDEYGSDMGNNDHYALGELLNIYTMNDIMITNILNKQYFGSIAGRSETSGQVVQIQFTVIGIETDNDGVFPDWSYIYLTIEENIDDIIDEYGEGIFNFGLDVDVNLTVGDNLIDGYYYPDLIPGDQHMTWKRSGSSVFKLTKEWNLIIDMLDTSMMQGSSQCSIDELIIDTIVAPHRIMQDIYENELNYQGNISESNLAKMDSLTSSWFNGFSMYEQEEAKNVIEGLFKSSIIIPAFRSDGQVKFIGIHQVWDGTEPFTLIPPHDVIKYSFALTKLEDVKNQVNVKYKYDLGSTEYEKETGYSIIDADNNEHLTLDEISESLGYSPAMTYDVEYYNLSDEEAKLEVETKYIRDDDVAKKFRKRLLLWYANQHITTKITLPVSYMHLEVGDYVAFSELLGGNKAFGYDYTDFTNKNGQLAYPYFFITKIDKSLESVSVEAVQMLRGEYGFPDGWEDWVVPGTDAEGDEVADNGDTVDGRGNDVTENWDIPDPNDNPDYGNDGTIDEGEEETDELYLNAWWNAQYGNNLKGFCEAIITTNLQREWTHELWITELTEDLTYMDADNVEQTIRAGTYPPGEIRGNILWGSSQSFIGNPGLGYEENNYGGRVTVHQKMELLETIKVKGTLIIKDVELELRTDDPIDEGGDDFEVPLLQTSLQFIQTGRVFDENLGILPITHEKGDITRDGIINVLDIVAMVNFILWDPLTTWEDFLEDNHAFGNISEELARYILDLNEDGIVNVQDVIIIINIILG